MKKYRKLLLIALGLIIISFLIPNSLHINDYYNSINLTETTCFDCNYNHFDFIGMYMFIILICIGIIIFGIICYKDKKKKKNLGVVI